MRTPYYPVVLVTQCSNVAAAWSFYAFNYAANVKPRYLLRNTCPKGLQAERLVQGR